MTTRITKSLLRELETTLRLFARGDSHAIYPLKTIAALLLLEAEDEWESPMAHYRDEIDPPVEVDPQWQMWFRELAGWLNTAQRLPSSQMNKLLRKSQCLMPPVPEVPLSEGGMPIQNLARLLLKLLSKA